MTTITEDEENYVRMGFLLFKICNRAVRFVFNNEFHPSIVGASIRRATKKLNDLKKKNIIKLYQWNLLFPRQDQPDSEKFDVTLMITLLTNLTTLEHYKGLPLATDTSTSADLGRVRYYRNHLSHIEDAKIDKSFFSKAWEDIIQAVGRLGGKSMLDECKKLRTIVLERSTVPWNLKVQIDQIITDWEKHDSVFVETRAANHVLECIRGNGCVTIIASPGVGKTATLRHVALQMKTEGYDVLPVTKPHDIVSFNNPNQKTLFVIDDFCGTYSLNRSELNSLESEMKRLETLITNKLTKIIVACRLQVYQDDEFKLLEIFRTCVCNLCTQDLCLSQTEKSSIAELYLGTKNSEIIQYSDLYDCFPLLCKLCNENPRNSITDFFLNPFSVYEAEIDKFYTQKHLGKYCALALCVMFNNRLKKEWLTKEVNCQIRLIINNTCQACKLSSGTARLKLLDDMKSLKNTFIKKEHGQYRALHDRMFDFLVSYFGQRMIKCLITYSVPAVIMQRFSLDRTDDIDRFVTIIPSEYHQLYIQRMIHDWSHGYMQSVFNNINMKIPEFRERFLCYVQTMDESFQRNLAHTKDCNDASSVLLMCCQYDAIPFIQWCLNHGVDINQCNCFGTSPLQESTQHGHTEVLKFLLARNGDINLSKRDGAFPLITACFNGNKEIVKVILGNKSCLRKNLTQASPVLNRVNWTLSRSFLAAGFPFLFVYLFGAFEILLLLCSLVIFNFLVNWCFYATDVDKCLPIGMSSLTLSISRNEIEIVKLLLDNKADINDCRTEGFSPLYIAASDNNIELVKVLLDYKPDIDKCSPSRKFPLFIACQNNYKEIVKILLDSNADTNKCMDAESTLGFITCQTHLKETDKMKLDKLKDKCKENGATPLFIACLNNNIEIVQLLLENKADINKCIGDGITPLFIACSRNRIEIVNMLLYFKADVNRCTDDGRSPLGTACKNNNTEIVKILLYNEDKLNECTFDGYPLHNACANNNIEIVKLLLDSKANIDERRIDDGVFPLYIACWNNYIELVKLLLNKKADVKQVVYDYLIFDKKASVGSFPHVYVGKSLLYIACANNLIEIVKVLLDYKADINTCIDNGASPLYVACQNNHIDIVKVLLDNKANINKCMYDGASPLYVACDKNHIETVKVLLDYKANINKCMYNGASPLYVACQNNHIDIVKVLLDNKADINKCINNGATPLYVACQNSHINIVKVLLDNEADINKCTNEGKSPFFISCYHNHKQIVRILLAKGSNYNACTYNGLSPLAVARRHGYSDIVNLIDEYSNNEEPPNKKIKVGLFD